MNFVAGWGGKERGKERKRNGRGGKGKRRGEERRMLPQQGHKFAQQPRCFSSFQSM